VGLSLAQFTLLLLLAEMLSLYRHLIFAVNGRINQPDSAIKPINLQAQGGILERRRRPTLKLQWFFSLWHFVAINLHSSTQRGGALSP
jgi:hypothetical protein